MKLIVFFVTLMPLLITLNSYATETKCKFNSKECFTKAGYPACRNRVDIDKYYEFLNSGKKEMAEQIISDKKRCITLKGNSRVAVQYNDNNKVKIYFRGSNQSYWVINDAVYSRAK